MLRGLWNVLILSYINFLNCSDKLNGNYPICDVSVDSTICIHNNERMLLPFAQPFGLIGNYSFDEKRVIDNSGNKNHGIGEFYPGPGISGIGSSGLFRKSYVNIPTFSNLEKSDYSYTFFLFLLQDEQSITESKLQISECPILHKGYLNINEKIANPGIAIDSYTKKLVIFTSGRLNENLTSQSIIQPGSWTHIALIKQFNKFSLYVNGILDFSSYVSNIIENTGNDYPLYIGSAPWAPDSCDIPILIDELKVYNYGIGVYQIQAEASITLGGIEPSFVHIGCTNCNRNEAASSCPQNTHFCNRLEVIIGGYQVAKRLGLESNVILSNDYNLTENIDAKGTGLCCTNSKI